jgi:hypothetical protein
MRDDMNAPADNNDAPPPPVEGHIPDAEEMEFKASNGRYYIDNVWKIVNEFPTAHVYGPVATDVDGLVEKLAPDARVHGFDVVDSSSRLNSAVNCMQMAVAWHQIVHDARNTDTVHVVRRTPQNSGVVLMIQRQEHLRGQCTEFAPASFIILVRDHQLLFTRDRVLPQADTERLVLAAVKAVKTNISYVSCDVPNMPLALFHQQIKTLAKIMENCGLEQTPDPALEDAALVDVTDAMRETSLGTSEQVSACE